MTNKYLEKIASSNKVSPTTGESLANGFGVGLTAVGLSHAVAVNKNSLANENFQSELRGLKRQGLTPDLHTKSRLLAYERVNPNLGKQLLKHRVGGVAAGLAGVSLVGLAHNHYGKRMKGGK